MNLNEEKSAIGKILEEAKKLVTTKDIDVDGVTIHKGTEVQIDKKLTDHEKELTGGDFEVVTPAGFKFVITTDEFMGEVNESQNSTTFHKSLDIIYDNLSKVVNSNVQIEYVEAIKLYTGTENDNEEGNFEGNWIEIYAPKKGSQFDFSKIAIYLTPNHPFGQDTPDEVFDVNDIAGIVSAVKKLADENLN